MSEEPALILRATDEGAISLAWLHFVILELRSAPAERIAESRKLVVDMLQHCVESGVRVNGLGECLLAGLLELIRVANYGAEKYANTATEIDAIRAALCKTRVE